MLRYISLFLLIGLFSAPASAQTQDVPVRQVVLFNNGVGYFEHGGQIQGTETTELRFRTPQIKDVLKSLVLQDLDGGQIGTVVYPSRDPLNRTLRSFQVDLTNTPSLGAILNQLRGSAVQLQRNGRSVRGTILGAEQRRTTTGGGVAERWQINLFADGSIRSLPLDEVRQLTFEDARLQEDIEKALGALAQARDREKKPVRIQFEGDGTRRVRIGYVVEAPVWKTSYRLLLPPSGETEGHLQGWAIVENQTESDWEDVDLTLVSGQPISFVQDLYTPLYVDRPVVAPPTGGNPRPQQYEGGIRQGAQELDLGNESIGGVVRDAQTGRPLPGANVVLVGPNRGATANSEGRYEITDVPRGQYEVRARFVGYTSSTQSVRKGSGPARVDFRMERGGSQEDVVVSGMAPSNRAESKANAQGESLQLNASLDLSASVSAAAETDELGPFFQYTLGDVTLPRRRSAMIPIVTTPVAVERVSIYNASEQDQHPLHGAWLDNTTGLHLAQGPIAVFDEHAYAGDARLTDVPAGQDRLLAYAVNQDVRIDTESESGDQTLQIGRIVDGVLETTRTTTAQQTYTLANEGDRETTVVIEHPRRAGWDLVDPAEADESTADVHRFRVTVAAGATTDFTVATERIRDQQYRLVNANASQVQVYLRANQIPSEVRDALERLHELRRAVEEVEREIQLYERERNRIPEEQERIRENMQAVDSSSDYYERLLAKLEAQEDRLEELDDTLEDLRAERDERRSELERFVRDLDVR